MVETESNARGRQWADIATIVTGLSLLALAIWPGDPSASAGAEREVPIPNLLWIAHVVAGASAIASVFVAQRWDRRPLARALLILGGLLLLAVLLVFRDFGPRALLTVLLPAAVLLAASAAIGPVPRDT